MARAQAKRSLHLRAKGAGKLFSRGVENLSTSTPTSGSQAPPGNPVLARLCLARQSLLGIAFPGRAWERGAHDFAARSPNRQVNLASIENFKAKPAVQLPGRPVPFIDG